MSWTHRDRAAKPQPKGHLLLIKRGITVREYVVYSNIIDEIWKRYFYW